MLRSRSSYLLLLLLVGCAADPTAPAEPKELEPPIQINISCAYCDGVLPDTTYIHVSCQEINWAWFMEICWVDFCIDRSGSYSSPYPAGMGVIYQVPIWLTFTVVAGADTLTKEWESP